MMEFEDLLSLNLRLGVILSSALMLIGLILISSESGIGITTSQLINPVAGSGSHGVGIAQTLGGVLQLHGISFIFLGIIVLIATPVLRVLLSIMSFLHRRNWTYVIITSIVFVNLVVAIAVIPGLIAK